MATEYLMDTCIVLELLHGDSGIKADLMNTSQTSHKFGFDSPRAHFSTKKPIFLKTKKGWLILFIASVAVIIFFYLLLSLTHCSGLC